MKALLFILLIIGISQSNFAQTSKKFDIQGHRGARGLMPENTIPAFKKGLDLGVITLEMDAQISQDQKVVISHDPYFTPEITLTPQGQPITVADEQNLVLYHMDYSVIKTYDVGSKYYPAFPEQVKIKTYKPLLSDVIDSAEIHALQIGRSRSFYYNIEIKSYKFYDGKYYSTVQQYVDLVMAVILQKRISSRVIIQSFDVRALQYMHQKYPTIKLALNANSSDSLHFATRLTQLGFTPDLFSINYDAVTSQLVQDCASKGIKLVPFTVDDLNAMRQLKTLGVNGFMTDYPDRAKQL